MSVAWTTILVLVLILPGISFFVGLHSGERYPRDAGQGRALIDLALALLVAIILHTALFYLVLIIDAMLPFIDLDTLFFQIPDGSQSADDTFIAIKGVLIYATIYVVVSCIAGWFVGFLASKLMVAGTLRGLATHRWVYDLIKYKGKEGGFINAYVMTNVQEEERVLMYHGFLEEFFLSPDGKIANLVLTDCRRYYMTLQQGLPQTGQLRAPLSAGVKTTWDYFVMSGENIANVLFTQTPLIETKNSTINIDQRLETLAQTYRDQIRRAAEQRANRPTDKGVAP